MPIIDILQQEDPSEVGPDKGVMKDWIIGIASVPQSENSAPFDGFFDHVVVKINATAAAQDLAVKSLLAGAFSPSIRVRLPVLGAWVAEG
jgi:hypothetical protein